MSTVPAAGPARVRRMAVLAALALTAAAAPGQLRAYGLVGDLDAGGTVFGGPTGNGLDLQLAFSGATLGSDLAVKTSASGALRLQDTTASSGAAKFRTDFGLGRGPAIPGLSVFGEGSFDADGETAASGAVVSLSWENDDFGLELHGTGERSFLDDASWKAGASFEASSAFGSVVLRLGGYLSFEAFDAGGSETVAGPVLAATWYPGFPVSADCSAGWKRSDASGGIEDALPLTAYLAAAPARWLVLSADAYFLLGLGEPDSIDEGSLEFTAVFTAADDPASGRSLRFPLGVTAEWENSALSALEFFAGIRLSLYR